jgi:hypothetical protein
LKVSEKEGKLNCYYFIVDTQIVRKSVHYLLRGDLLVVTQRTKQKTFDCVVVNRLEESGVVQKPRQQQSDHHLQTVEDELEVDVEVVLRLGTQRPPVEVYLCVGRDPRQNKDEDYHNDSEGSPGVPSDVHFEGVPQTHTLLFRLLNFFGEFFWLSKL